MNRETEVDFCAFPPSGKPDCRHESRPSLGVPPNGGQRVDLAILAGTGIAIPITRKAIRATAMIGKRLCGLELTTGGLGAICRPLAPLRFVLDSIPWAIGRGADVRVD